MFFSVESIMCSMQLKSSFWKWKPNFGTFISLGVHWNWQQYGNKFTFDYIFCLHLSRCLQICNQKRKKTLPKQIVPLKFEAFNWWKYKHAKKVICLEQKIALIMWCRKYHNYKHINNRIMTWISSKYELLRLLFFVLFGKRYSRQG